MYLSSKYFRYCVAKLAKGRIIKEKFTYSTQLNSDYLENFECVAKKKLAVNEMLLSSTFSRIIGNNFPKSIYLSQKV